MGYYIRVLGLRDLPIALDDLRTAAGKGIELRIEEGTEREWNSVSFLHRPDGPEIMMVEKNPVLEGELGAEELQEFIDETPHYKPQSAVDWLKSFLPQVKVIYAFQLLSGTDVNNGWSVVHGVQHWIWKKVGGILQADREGFTNEAGYTILWQFSEGVKSLWNMAVLDAKGKWVAFEMELGDTEQKSAFLAGNVPRGVRFL